MTDETKPDGDANKPPKQEAVTKSPEAKSSADKPVVPATKSDAPSKSPAAAAGKPARPKPPRKPPPEPPKRPEDPPVPEDMEVPAFVTALQGSVPEAVELVSYSLGDWTVIVLAERLIEVATFLRDDAVAVFDYCSDVTATDWPPRPQRFDVVYCLYSTRLRHRIRIKVRAAEGDEVPSVSGIWPAANWLEREVWDQFGVNIVGHPDLRRILMPDDWQGHPQRKDYPLEGPGEFLMENPQDWLRLRNLTDEAEIE
jgi:NADH-quinone oxidoreductase subunit C